MNTIKHNQNCLNILAQHCVDVDQYARMVDFLNKIKDNIDTYGLVDVYEAYMSTETYKSISDLIYNRRNAIIVDCGCGEGLQQLLFQDCKQYIGIDIHKTQEVLTDNAIFIQGNVEKVLGDLTFPKENDVYGISVLCGMCFDKVRDAMYKRFTKIINI